MKLTINNNIKENDCEIIYEKENINIMFKKKKNILM